ncbi:MAG: S1/P1 nuclease [Tepidisphaeraceae bacterium]
MKLRPRLIALVVCAAVLLLLPRVARAWNDTGHMIVARLAWQQFTDDERREVVAILKAHPHYEVYLSRNRPERVGEAEWSFLRAAVWADFIRPARPGSEAELFKGLEITRFHRDSWHYIDVPWVPPVDRKTIDPTTLPSRTPETTSATTAPAEPQNVLEALDYNNKLLGGRDIAAAERAVALTWISHLIGDLHQPLHACSVYSTAFPTGDRGGNEEAVRANGAVVRLHGYWDSALGTSDGYDAVVFLARLIADDPALAVAKLTELAEDESFTSWMNESHAFAIALVHLNGRLKSAVYASYDAQQITADEVPPLPASYDANARDVSQRRVALAGHRLAATVKAALAAEK